jgi:hypothetical protein
MVRARADEEAGTRDGLGFNATSEKLRIRASVAVANAD